LVARAHASALGVAGTLSPDALDDELAAMMGAAASAAASAAVDTSASDAPAEAEEEEDEEEEGGFDGLGSLFG
jgi:ribosomal protein L12E/L44/L45/RPP1/RPP2